VRRAQERPAPAERLAVTASAARQAAGRQLLESQAGQLRAAEAGARAAGGAALAGRPLYAPTVLCTGRRHGGRAVGWRRARGDELGGPRRPVGAPGEKDAKLAQKLGKPPPFTAASPPECTGQLASFGPA
jgi:hypothetical protein